ncbi:hypothetical protein BGZ83_011999 [Gryganskiella cystojenkinii]|nr:hypothetical protein BGZ83_011999 [Gryganskiella cystojenkinii]
MKTFKEHILVDEHHHTTFDKAYACYMAYLGREARSGSQSAKDEKVSIEDCRQVYQKTLVQGTTSRAQSHATKIVRRAIDQHSEDALKSLTEDEDNTGQKDLHVQDPLHSGPEPTLTRMDSANETAQDGAQTVDDASSESHAVFSTIIWEFLQSQPCDVSSPSPMPASSNKSTDRAASPITFSGGYMQDTGSQNPFSCTPTKQAIDCKASKSSDWIADFSSGSEFEQALPAHLRPALDLSELAAIDVNTRWPTLKLVFERVFKKNGYDEIASAVKKEDLADPIAFYLISIVSGQFADGTGFSGANQIYLAEAALLHEPKPEKLKEDEYKLDFGRRMKAAALSCIELAVRVELELQKRESEKVPASFRERLALHKASCEIHMTSPTPEKPKKRKFSL